MVVTCSDCKVEYDDIYHYTNCPHEYFEMHTIVSTDHGSKCCHTIEEVDSFTNSKK